MATILITTGGTIEPIDGVRGITNFSSGRLGCIIAEQYLLAGHNVILVHGKKVHLPTNLGVYLPRLVCHPITDTNSLMDILSQLSTQQIDVVIHAMAVSDYTVKALLNLDDLIDQLSALDVITTDDVVNLLSASTPPVAKASSAIKAPIITLTQTPKVIQSIKTFWPNCKLVGFKLLNNVSISELIEVARQARAKSNDLQSIAGNHHVGYLIDSSGNTYQGNTKQQIANLIVEHVI
jgi:phosphopantothenate-cysteine ligase